MASEGHLKELLPNGGVRTTTFNAPMAVVVESYTNSTRPSATGRQKGDTIWNESDNAPNFADGAGNWRDAMGNIT